MFDAIFDWIEVFLAETLANLFNTLWISLIGQLDSAYTSAVETLSQPPSLWLGGFPYNNVFNIMQGAIMPIAGGILAFMIAYDLVQILLERNNSVDFDVSSLFKWIVKSIIMIIVVTNSWFIIGGIADIGSQAIANENTANTHPNTVEWFAGLPQIFNIVQVESAGIPPRPRLVQGYPNPDMGERFAVVIALAVITVLTQAIRAVLFVVTVGRFIEILIVMSIAPIPLATLGNSHFSGIGWNYLKTMLAYAMLGFLFIVAFQIFFGIVEGTMSAEAIVFGQNAIPTFLRNMFSLFGYSLLLILALFRLPALAKSLFGAA